MRRLLEGRRLFQCGYPKVRRLLEGDAYLRPCAYKRKYGNVLLIDFVKNTLLNLREVLQYNSLLEKWEEKPRKLQNHFKHIF